MGQPIYLAIDVPTLLALGLLTLIAVIIWDTSSH